MEKLIVFVVVLLAHYTSATDVILKLAPEEYARMPPKHHVDRFHRCMDQPGGVYCSAHADVVTDGPSELYDMMKGYSAFSLWHFNYTKLTYGKCMTRECKKYYTGDSEPELRVAAEACLNESLYQEYGLKTRVTKVNCYFEDKTKNKHQVDWVDCAVTAVFLIIFALNVIGSIYDFARDQTKPGNKWLLSFSCRFNWKLFIAPPSSDPRAMELESLHGIRFLTCMLIVLVHVPTGSYAALDNLNFIEKGYETSQYYVLFNAHLTTQSFFLMSGFLMTYNMLLSGIQELTWKQYFKSIFLRFVRLSPLSLTMLALMCTWLRHAPLGPYWQEQLGLEVDDCRTYWLYNAFFIQNYVDTSSCNLPSWSTACDFQLHIIGMTVILLAPSPSRRRRVILALLCLVGVVWPTYNIVTRDLDGALISHPEDAITTYVGYETIHYVHKRTYVNMHGFIIGMLLGYLVFDWQNKKLTTKDYSKYRYAYWMLVPVLYALVVSGGYLFYQAGPRPSLLLRVLFAPIVKPLFGLTMALIIFGAINKVENVYRRILEWRGFTPLAKLTYGIYTFHLLLVRFFAGSRSTLVYYSDGHIMQDFFSIALMSLILSFVLHMTIESPITHVVKMVCKKRAPPAPPSAVKDTKTE